MTFMRMLRDIQLIADLMVSISFAMLLAVACAIAFIYLLSIVKKDS